MPDQRHMSYCSEKKTFEEVRRRHEAVKGENKTSQFGCLHYNERGLLHVQTPESLKNTVVHNLKCLILHIFLHLIQFSSKSHEAEV